MTASTDVLAAYREHVSPGDTISLGMLADLAGAARSAFVAAALDLERCPGVRIDRVGRHPNDIYLTVGVPS